MVDRSATRHHAGPMPSVDVLARRVADAAVAWLADPRDQQAYGRLVSAIEAYSTWRQPVLDLDVLEAVARLARVADTTAVGELIRTDPDFRAAIGRLQRHASEPTLDGTPADPSKSINR